jgi:hypothetical protein
MCCCIDFVSDRHHQNRGLITRNGFISCCLTMAGRVCSIASISRFVVDDNVQGTAMFRSATLL